MPKRRSHVHPPITEPKKEPIGPARLPIAPPIEAPKLFKSAPSHASSRYLNNIVIANDCNAGYPFLTTSPMIEDFERL